MGNYSEFIKKSWEEFVSTGEINSKVREEIKDSWIRCKKNGVDPYNGRGIIKHPNIDELIKRNSELIYIARPIMESIHSIISRSSFALFLVDKDGYIIDVIGDKCILKMGEELNFIKGELWSEEAVGTNAIGTALYLNKAFQTIGAEHYGVKQHSWTCSAAPIYDEYNNLIGCINMSGNYYNAHSHTLGIVTAAAQSMQKQMALLASYNLLNITFHSISEGMVVINKDMKIKRINGSALKILNISLEEVKNMDINKILKDINFQGFIEEKKFLNNYECDISIDDRNIKCIINIFPMNNNGKNNGAVITFTEMKFVHKLVNKFVGYKAKYEFKDIITNDLEMKNIISFAKKAAKTDCNILIEGESGTGKELIAQSIHNFSNRSRGPFVAVNCASIPSELVESELFGYDKGAFTGALKEGRPGKFELADGGTIFLDELGELPLDIQSKLLRVLDNGKVVRVGGINEKQLDVRVIGATNRELRNEVDKRNFREDLFYRLSVMEIKIIPLRSRIDDIDLLVKYLINKLNEKNNNKFTNVKQSYINELKKYDWPGNIRELKNVIERDYYLSEGEIMSMSSGYHDNQLDNIIKKEDISIKDTEIIPLDKVEEKTIRDAIEKCNGNIQLAAKLLRIGRATLYRKIKKYEIVVSK
jgi:sigma-54 dependent transcriptional regulator, acetoin dehydrogenase operon transcriptional activator AcoR